MATTKLNKNGFENYIIEIEQTYSKFWMFGKRVCSSSFAGSSTVWYTYPDGERVKTGMEYKLAEISGLIERVIIQVKCPTETWIDVSSKSLTEWIDGELDGSPTMILVDKNTD